MVKNIIKFVNFAWWVSSPVWYRGSFPFDSRFCFYDFLCIDDWCYFKVLDFLRPNRFVRKEVEAYRNTPKKIALELFRLRDTDEEK